MKKVLFTILILIGFISSQAQKMPINKETGEIEYQEVVQLKDINKDEVYLNAKNWMLSTLKSSDNMIQLDDVEKKQLIGSGTMVLKKRSLMTGCLLNFKVIIKFKEGRYQYTINNFLHFYNQNGVMPLRSNLKQIMTNNWGGKPMKKRKQEEIRKEVHAKIETLINSMNIAIAKNNNEKDNW